MRTTLQEVLFNQNKVSVVQDAGDQLEPAYNMAGFLGQYTIDVPLSPLQV